MLILETLVEFPSNFFLNIRTPVQLPSLDGVNFF